MEALKLPTIEDIYALPEDVHAELIDGQIFYHAAPSTEHQEVVIELATVIRNYIKQNDGNCKVYPAPFAVFLQDDKHYVEPDISVICDKDKIDNKGCHGAPDWIIEVVSQDTMHHDTIRKLKLYFNVGVREYWIVDPDDKTVIVYNFEKETKISFHGFEKVKAGIYEDLEIDFSGIDI